MAISGVPWVEMSEFPSLTHLPNTETLTETLVREELTFLELLLIKCNGPMFQVRNMHYGILLKHFKNRTSTFGHSVHYFIQFSQKSNKMVALIIRVLQMGELKPRG